MSNLTSADSLWYKDAIFYEVRVRSFYDSKGHGIGDLRGLAEKLDYIKDLGVTTIWILPFYESPMRDDGYDIADYTQVHPDYGNLQDFKYFLREAHKRGLRVVTELVVNHTSSQHPWFQRARRAKPYSKWRNFYVWSDSKELYKDARIIFKDFETSNWTWDPVAQAYYWHRFYSHQPDLNFDNPDVVREIFKIVDFWFSMGIDGFRLDAIPYLIEREGTNCENLPETHIFLKQLKKHVSEKYKDRMLLAEANQWPEDAVAYFGDGDECDMAFHFPIMPRMYMSLQREDRFPLIDIWHQTPPIPESSQWALFLRNHDELTLEMVTDEERDYMYRTYAMDPQARLNLGIRRRLAPLLDNDRRKIELMNSLLLSLPGTPVIYYGDEIGMGDNIYLGDRNGVRTPMQWSSDRNAGFSKANPQQLYLPVIVDPEYHYNTVNVENQVNNPNSLLSWMKRIISLRKKFKAFGRGTIEFIEPKNRKVLAYVRSYHDEVILVVVNFSRFVQYVELDLSPYKGRRIVELFGGTEFPPVKDDHYLLSIGRHSFYWFSITPEMADEYKSVASRLTIPLLETSRDWSKIFEEKRELEGILPDYLKTCHWFEGKTREIKSVKVIDTVSIPHELSHYHIVFIQVDYHEERKDKYMLPIAFASEDDAKKLLLEFPETVIAKILVNKNKHMQEGVIYDALHDKSFYKSLLEAIFKKRTYKSEEGWIAPLSVSGIRKGSVITGTSLDSISVNNQFSNALATFGEKMILKIYRHLEEGVNPDLEIGRFLNLHVSQASFAAARGALEYQKSDGTTITLGVLQGYITNQGTAWQYTLEELEKFFEETIRYGNPDEFIWKNKSILDSIRENPPEKIEAMMSHYLEAVRMVGQRTAEFHSALTTDQIDKDFAPEPFSTLYQRGVYQSMRTTLFHALDSLNKRLQDIPEDIVPVAKTIMKSQDKILNYYKKIMNQKILATRIRIHGDYNLEQLLFTGKDFVIIDFEGDVTKPISERKLKKSALRDVVSMIVSLKYAALVSLKKRFERGSSTNERTSFLKIWTQIWHQWASSVFLKSYLNASASMPHIPDRPEELKLLFNLFLYDHSVHLLNHELAHRLDLVDIPLQILSELLEQRDRES